MKKLKPSGFVISLDFELFWGVHDVIEGDNYKTNLLNAKFSVEEILDLFDVFDISATWAVVGMLLAEDELGLSKYRPELLPEYSDGNLNPYNKLSNLLSDDIYFANDVIEKIKVAKNQKLASHTYSHYYALEDGQNLEAFKSDVNAFDLISKNSGFSPSSIVFPKNQCNENYFPCLLDNGINIYRGVEEHWIYRESKFEQSYFRRLFRLMDSYFNLTGHHVFNINARSNMISVPSSRFLRPYSKKSNLLNWLRLNRIKKSMTYAAKQGGFYHIWWHPHNFGQDVESNMFFLRSILKHYKFLEREYGMKSFSMESAVDFVKNS